MPVDVDHGFARENVEGLLKEMAVPKDAPARPKTRECDLEMYRALVGTGHDRHLEPIAQRAIDRLECPLFLLDHARVRHLRYLSCRPCISTSGTLSQVRGHCAHVPVSVAGLDGVFRHCQIGFALFHWDTDISPKTQDEAEVF